MGVARIWVLDIRCSLDDDYRHSTLMNKRTLIRLTANQAPFNTVQNEKPHVREGLQSWFHQGPEGENRLQSERIVPGVEELHSLRRTKFKCQPKSRTPGRSFGAEGLNL